MKSNYGNLREQKWVPHIALTCQPYIICIVIQFEEWHLGFPKMSLRHQANLDWVNLGTEVTYL